MKTRMTHPNYIHISELRYIRLHPMEKDVLRELLSYQGARRINPTIKHIAWNTGWSRDSVLRALAYLLDREFIAYEVWHNGHPQREGRPANVYSLQVHNIRKAIAEGRAEHDKLFIRHPSGEFSRSQPHNSEFSVPQPPNQGEFSRSQLPVLLSPSSKIGCQAA